MAPPMLDWAVCVRAIGNSWLQGRTTCASSGGLHRRKPPPLLPSRPCGAHPPPLPLKKARRRTRGIPERTPWGLPQRCTREIPEKRQKGPSGHPGCRPTLRLTLRPAGFSSSRALEGRKGPQGATEATEGGRGARGEAQRSPRGGGRGGRGGPFPRRKRVNEDDAITELLGYQHGSSASTSGTNTSSASRSSSSTSSSSASSTRRSGRAASGGAGGGVPIPEEETAAACRGSCGYDPGQEAGRHSAGARVPGEGEVAGWSEGTPLTLPDALWSLRFRRCASGTMYSAVYCTNVYCTILHSVQCTVSGTLHYTRLHSSISIWRPDCSPAIPGPGGRAEQDAVGRGTQHSAAQYSVIQHSTIQYLVLPHSSSFRFWWRSRPRCRGTWRRKPGSSRRRPRPRTRPCGSAGGGRPSSAACAPSRGRVEQAMAAMGAEEAMLQALMREQEEALGGRAAHEVLRCVDRRKKPGP